MRPSRSLRRAALLTGFALSPTLAQANEASDATLVEDVVVTGSRGPAVRALESSSPIQVIGAEQLARTGTASLLQSLERLAPSINVPGNTGGDLSNLVRTARLRGLSPNHTLVLVNGRRRHTSSVVNATPGPVQAPLPSTWISFRCRPSPGSRCCRTGRPRNMAQTPSPAW